MEGSTVARGEQLWQPYVVRGTIGGAVFGSAGQLAARTTYGVTVPTSVAKHTFCDQTIHIVYLSVYQRSLIF